MRRRAYSATRKHTGDPRGVRLPVEVSQPASQAGLARCSFDSRPSTKFKVELPHIDGRYVEVRRDFRRWRVRGACCSSFRHQHLGRERMGIVPPLPPVVWSYAFKLPPSTLHSAVAARGPQPTFVRCLRRFDRLRKVRQKRFEVPRNVWRDMDT